MNKPIATVRIHLAQGCQGASYSTLELPFSHLYKNNLHRVWTHLTWARALGVWNHLRCGWSNARKQISEVKTSLQATLQEHVLCKLVMNECREVAEPQSLLGPEIGTRGAYLTLHVIYIYDGQLLSEMLQCGGTWWVAQRHFIEYLIFCSRIVIGHHWLPW